MIPLKPSQAESSWRRLNAPTNSLARSFGNRLSELWEAKDPGESVSFKFRGTNGADLRFGWPRLWPSDHRSGRPAAGRDASI